MTLRPYQRAALDAIDAAWNRRGQRVLIVLPAGSGKTLVGLAAAARLARRTVVLSANTATAGQWLNQWHEVFTPTSDTARPSTSSSLDDAADITSVTFDEVAPFDADTEVDAGGEPVRGHDRTLGPLADRLCEVLQSADGPATLIIDDCHHLLDVWGTLLEELLTRVAGARVVALSATPTWALAQPEAERAIRVVGPAVYEASLPALVRQGYVAPYAELAWLCQPAADEHEWLAAHQARFEELRAEATATGFASTDFYPWLDAFVAEMAPGHWDELTRSSPDLVAAVMRAHHDGMVDAPAGSAMRAPYRVPMTADDWAMLLGEYTRSVLLDSVAGTDQACAHRLVTGLAAVGVRVTSRGVRRTRSAGAHIVARSEAKTACAADIVAAESASLAGRLRALIVCDHETATASLPVGLSGVMDSEAGSAVAVAQRLAGDARLASRGIVLVTSSTVAASARGAAIVRAARPDLPWRTEGTLTFFGEGLGSSGVPAKRSADSASYLPGWSGSTGWGPHVWVPLISDLFDNGAISVLVGTRALLGEGWDARSVTTVVDLTTATSPSAVTAVRGRALRLDPAWPDKVAHTWTVACVAPDDVRGHDDYLRLVAKHDVYFGCDARQRVVAGVDHLDDALSPYSPGDPASWPDLNARMLTRSADRGHTRVAWRIGGSFHDRVTPTVLVTSAAGDDGRSTGGAGAGATAADEARAGEGDLTARVLRRDVLPAAGGLSADVAKSPGWVIAAMVALVAVAFVTGVAAYSGGSAVLGGVAGALLLGVVGLWWLGRRAGDVRALAAYRQAALAPTAATYGEVVAAALGYSGQVHIDSDDGVTGLGLPGPAARRFATALDEILNEPTQPRFVVARPVLAPLPADPRQAATQARAAAKGRLETVVVCHAVPTVFGANTTAIVPFRQSWRELIADTDPLSTAGRAGAGLLASAETRDPAGVVTSTQVVWD